MSERRRHQPRRVAVGYTMLVISGATAVLFVIGVLSLILHGADWVGLVPLLVGALGFSFI